MEMGLTQIRRKLGPAVERVKMLGEICILTSYHGPVAAIVPAEIGQLVAELGPAASADALRKLLNDDLKKDVA